MLYAYLNVSSDAHTLAELEALLGPSARRGDDGAGIGGGSIGDLLPRSGRVAECSQWQHVVVRQADELEGIDFAPSLSALGTDFADRIRTLVDAGAEATLRVVQEVHEHAGQGADEGFHLDKDAVAWAARAGADVDVDQYFFGREWWQSLPIWLDRRADDLRWQVRKLGRRVRSSARTTSGRATRRG